MSETLTHSAVRTTGANEAIAAFRHTGTVMLPAYSLFSELEMARIDQLCRQVPRETITLGDAGEPNDLYVGRFMVDKAAEMPRLVNEPQSTELLALLRHPRRRQFFARLIGRDMHIRRCQVNCMVKGSFIGRHLDIDSNPDYYVSVVLQLGRAFSGGEFVVFADRGSENVFSPTHGTVIVSQCTLPHEVRKVRGGERTSLVWFLSDYASENRRAA
jgi:Rps23 Pro-64 3,4-dihydroxylase Tpa1-like proline 4-hydroxylase